MIDSDDIAWIGDNTTAMSFRTCRRSTGSSRKRDFQGLQFVLRKRYSDNWQALVSFLYSNSYRLRPPHAAAGHQRRGSDVLGRQLDEFSLNQTINNLDGPLPYTPKYEFKLSGSYHVPKIEVDLRRPAADALGRRPLWRSRRILSTRSLVVRRAASSTREASESSRVTRNIRTTCRRRPFSISASRSRSRCTAAQTVRFIVDGFNMFNTFTPTDADPHFEYGKVTAIPSPRRFRFGARFEF